MMTIHLGKDKEIRLSAWAVAAIGMTIAAVANAIGTAMSGKRG